jgi:hypothetical protein
MSGFAALGEHDRMIHRYRRTLNASMKHVRDPDK